MVTGRQAPVAGIDRIIAPLVSAMPIRVKFDPEETVGELLYNIQQQAISMIAYEQTELLDIRRISPEADRGSRFNTLLVVQPPAHNDFMDQGPFTRQPGFKANADGHDDFNPNAIMILCQLTNDDKLQLEISFDSQIVDEAQMARMASQFEHVLRQLCASTTQRVEDVELVSGKDVAELWKWNNSVPEAMTDCVHNMIGEMINQQPQAPAICSWDGNLTYSELDVLSGRLASRLISLGFGRGSIVPLCFEKSMWYPVAFLGAMRSGAACLAMDSTQPESRLRSIVQQVNPKLILSSAKNKDLAKKLGEADVVVVDRSHLEGQNADSMTEFPHVDSSDVLYGLYSYNHTFSILSFPQSMLIRDLQQLSSQVVRPVCPRASSPLTETSPLQRGIKPTSSTSNQVQECSILFRTISTCLGPTIYKPSFVEAASAFLLRRSAGTIFPAH
jgi:non-ribosomal peptide synthetase component F